MGLQRLGSGSANQDKGDHAMTDAFDEITRRIALPGRASLDGASESLDRVTGARGASGGTDMNPDETQEMLEECEREGLVERTGEERNGRPVFTFTPAGRHFCIVERWSNLNHRELLSVFAALLAADGQPML